MAIRKALRVAAVLPLMLAVISCSSEGSSSTTRIELGTMQGTTHFDRAAAWSAIVNDAGVGISITASSTTGTQEMLRRVAAGELDVGVVTSADLPQAASGSDPVDTSSLRALWGHDQGLWHIVVWADSPYQTLEDLNGARISVGPPGSLIAGVNEVLWRDIVGIDYTPVSVALPDAAEQMKDGQVDVFTVGAVLPQPVVADLAASRPIRLLPLPPDIQAEFVTKIGGWQAATIPASAAYAGQQNAVDIPTAGLSSMYIVNASMDDEVAYQITKALFENIDRFQSASNVNRGITLENTLNYVTIPLHPGALRYFQEKNIDTSHIPAA